MRAVQINQYGGPEVVVVNSNAPQPELKPGSVLVKVSAAGVNPSDWKIRQGLFQAWGPLTFPATLGGDFSGVVVEVGEGVSAYKVGDEVYGRAGAIHGGSGTFADFIVADINVVAPKPKSVGHTEAAALPLVAVSAWQALVFHMNLSKGPTFAKASAGRKRILIHGGAGGIGALAVQLAKHLGAHVATTVGAQDVAYARELGADEVIDYQTQRFEDVFSNFDAVFDTVGGETFTRSFAVLKSDGILVSMSHPQTEPPTDKQIQVVAQQTEVTAERLAKITELVDQGVFKVRIDKVFPLEQAGEAMTYLETGKAKGKVVIEIVE